MVESKCHSCESRNPKQCFFVIPAKAGIQNEKSRGNYLENIGTVIKDFIWSSILNMMVP